MHHETQTMGASVTNDILYVSVQIVESDNPSCALFMQQHADGKVVNKQEQYWTNEAPKDGYWGLMQEICEKWFTNRFERIVALQACERVCEILDGMCPDDEFTTHAKYADGNEDEEPLPPTIDPHRDIVQLTDEESDEP